MNRIQTRINSKVILFTLASLIIGTPILSHAESQAASTKHSEDASLAHVELAASYFQAGRLEIAQEELTRVFAKDPQNSYANDLQGLIYQKSGNFSQAEASFRTAVTSDPNNSSAQTNYGSLLCRTGRYDAGMDAFGKALQRPMHIQVSQTLVNGGICLAQKGDMQGAEKFLVKALEQEPFMPSALYQLSRVYYATNRYDQADSRLEALHSQVAPNAASTLLMYQLAVAEGKPEQARMLAQKLKLRFPDSQEAQQVKTR